jgi:hypothetical protein
VSHVPQSSPTLGLLSFEHQRHGNQSSLRFDRPNSPGGPVPPPPPEWPLPLLLLLLDLRAEDCARLRREPAAAMGAHSTASRQKTATSLLRRAIVFGLFERGAYLCRERDEKEEIQETMQKLTSTFPRTSVFPGVQAGWRPEAWREPETAAPSRLDGFFCG